MKKWWEKLLELKSILSIIFCGTSCYLAIMDKMDIATFVSLTAAIVTYYFTRKNDTKEEQNDEIIEIK